MLSIIPLIHQACDAYIDKVKSEINRTFGDTGTLANSLQYVVKKEGEGYAVIISFSVYGIILHHSAKKGSYKRRSFQADSKLITQDEKYKIIIRELTPLENELAEIIGNEVATEAIKIVLKAFENIK